MTTTSLPIPPNADRHRPVFRPADDGKPRTYFVNGAVLAQVLAEPSQPAADKNRYAKHGVRVERIDDRVNEVRANVRDAARAVLQWLAIVIEHDPDGEAAPSLDDVLRRCLRPSADPAEVSYAALAEDIHRVTGITLTAKRVQTAVRHLRDAAEKNHADAGHETQAPAEEPGDQTPDTKIDHALAALRTRLADHFTTLQASAKNGEAAGIRELGIDLLAAVRAAAARVIDRGFGEHITDAIDLGVFEGRFLDYVRDTVGAGEKCEVGSTKPETPCFASGSAPGASRLAQDFRRLLLTLADHPLAQGRVAASAEHDVKLVMHGSRIVAALLGPDSLPGVLAHLNVLVVGRDLIGTDLYIAEMLRLAHTAEQLHRDKPTQQLLRWCRRQSSDKGRKLPGAVRVASYARSNAATRLYQRCFLGQIDPQADAPLLPTMREEAPCVSYLALADTVLGAMEATDAGFTLTLTTRLLAHTTHAKLTGSQSKAVAYFRGLGESKTLGRLESLIKFDNSDEIVLATRRLAELALPGLRHRLLVTR